MFFLLKETNEDPFLKEIEKPFLGFYVKCPLYL